MVPFFAAARVDVNVYFRRVASAPGPAAPAPLSMSGCESELSEEAISKLSGISSVWPGVGSAITDSPVNVTRECSATSAPLAGLSVVETPAAYSS
jgi:hypothetical protein